MKRKADDEVSPMVLARRMLRRHAEVLRRLGNFEKRYRYLFRSLGLVTSEERILRDDHTVSALRFLHLPAIDQKALEHYLKGIQEDRLVREAIASLNHPLYRKIAEYMVTGASAEKTMMEFGVSMSTVRRAMREAASGLLKSDTFTPQKRTK